MFIVADGGGSVAQPVVFNFPNDALARSTEGTEGYMVGPVKVTPIMQNLGDAGATFKTFFGAGRWVNLAEVTYAGTSGLLTVEEGKEEVTL